MTGVQTCALPICKCLLLEEREPIAVPSEGKNRSFYTINRYRTCGTHYDEIPIILLPELINEHGWLLELETQELINRSVINFHEKGYCPFSFAEIRFLCEILKGFPPIKDIAAKLKIELSCAYAHRRNIVSKGRNFSCFFSTPEVIALFCRQMHWI